MSRWLAIKNDSGRLDEYAVALATHTVSKLDLGGRVQFVAWRLGAETGQSVKLGSFTGDHGAEAAKGACVADLALMLKAVKS